MNNNLLYTIKGLSCSYPGFDFPVLKVQGLEIHRGDVMFVLGPSGVGKSTLIETLGLMNNTVSSADVFRFSDQKNVIEKVHELWRGSEKGLADFRSKYLSFIFQNTNMFTHLTAFQNAVLPALILGGNEAEVRRDAYRLFDSILPGENPHKIISDYSGGQKQRVAFIRAILGNYEVLFADEPTGNLDSGNADKLMEEITASAANKKAVVVVSHDIDLALKFATKIICIDLRHDGVEWKGKPTSYGLIDSESLINRLDEKQWEIGAKEKLSEEQLIKRLKLNLKLRL